MKRIAYLILFLLSVTILGSCVASLAPETQAKEKKEPVANYSLTIQLYPGASYNEVASAAGSVVTPVHLQVIPAEPSLFSIWEMRMQYEGVCEADIYKTRQQIGKCCGIINVGISKE